MHQAARVSAQGPGHDDQVCRSAQARRLARSACGCVRQNSTALAQREAALGGAAARTFLNCDNTAVPFADW